MDALVRDALKLRFIETLIVVLCLFATPAWATFPTVAATNTSSSAPATSHTVSLPTGIVSGDLLIVTFASNANAITHSWPAGWTELYDQTSGTMSGSAAYRRADGTEGGTITVTVPVAAGQQADVSFWATATDLSGNESAPSLTVVRRIDRLAPAAPK